MSIHAIVGAQRDFYNSEATRSVEFRKAQLSTLRKLLVDNKKMLEIGVNKDLQRHAEVTESAEVDCIIHEVDFYLANIDTWASPYGIDTTHAAIPDDAKVSVVRDSKGVVLLITPWNHPVLMIFWPLVPIIAAGNTCIVKPSEISPYTADVIDGLIAKYFDSQYITVVQGDYAEVSELLQEKFDHIMYTGSIFGAKKVAAAAAQYLTPVTIEVGGKCPAVVLKDADPYVAAKRIAEGKWLNAGQSCVAPDYILTTEQIQPALVDALEDVLCELYGEDPKANTQYSRIINDRHFDRLVNYLGTSKASVLVRHGSDNDRDDLYIGPHILAARKEDSLMQEEIFGPFLPILTVNHFDEALFHVKTGEKPLAAYLFTNDEAKIKKFIEAVPASAVNVNDCFKHLGVDTMPRGGVGTSGMGRYTGKLGFDTFTTEKTVYKRTLNNSENSH